jgi:hypothetical protein
MARFYGKVGFLKDENESETRPSRFHPEMEERFYSGELLKNYASLQNAERPVDDFTLNNDISITADPYALNHFSSIKYVEFMGSLWEAKTVSVAYPRIRISFGGVYNGPTPDNP